MKKSNFEIFVYHRVGTENSLDGLTISKDAFRRQMEFLKRRRRPMALGAIVNLLRAGKAVPAGAVAVTFDDGYRDTFETALPILKKSKIPATVFITTGYIDGLVRAYRGAPMLTWKMIKKLKKAGLEIGAHTLTHPNLKKCSLKEVRRQMAGSKKRLEEKLKTPVRFFAYPYGGRRSISKKILECPEECGFDAACTTLPGKNGRRTDLYALRRQPSLRDEIRDLALQLERASGKIQKSGSKVQGITKKTKAIWTGRYKKARRWI